MKFIGKTLLVEELGKRILAIGDLHLGFENFLNNSGIFVSRQLFEEILKEFDKIFEKIESIDIVVLLGDVRHSFGKIMKQEWDEIPLLFEYLNKKTNKIIIVKGNHDTMIEAMVKRFNVEVKDYFVFGKYCFVHGNRAFDEMDKREIKYWIMGHGHPAVKIENGVRTEKYKCFLVGKFKKKNIIIVPSFVEHNAGSDPRESELGMAWKFNYNNFEVFVEGENLEVKDFGKLRFV